MAKMTLKQKKQAKIAKVMHEGKMGTLNIGKSKKTAKSKKQMTAIALSEAEKLKKKRKTKKK